MNLQSSEKIDMGGIATKYQHLNDLYAFVLIFLLVLNITYELLGIKL